MDNDLLLKLIEQSTSFDDFKLRAHAWRYATEAVLKAKTWPRFDELRPKIFEMFRTNPYLTSDQLWDAYCDVYRRTPLP
jgi:hypothetical protein